MNKKNLGYHIGKLYLKFRQWQHPAILKWLYVLVPIAVVFIFSNFFVWVFIIAFSVMVATRYDNEEKENEELNKSAMDSGHSFYWWFLNDWRK